MQRGFISYVQGGEKYFIEPACIMGGVIGSPLRMVYNFFRVAIFSIWLHLREAGSLGLVRCLFECMLVFTSAVGIIWRPVLDELRM